METAIKIKLLNPIGFLQDYSTKFQFITHDDLMKVEWIRDFVKHLNTQKNEAIFSNQE